MATIGHRYFSVWIYALAEQIDGVYGYKWNDNTYFYSPISRKAKLENETKDIVWGVPEQHLFPFNYPIGVTEDGGALFNRTGKKAPYHGTRSELSVIQFHFGKGTPAKSAEGKNIGWVYNNIATATFRDHDAPYAYTTTEYTCLDENWEETTCIKQGYAKTILRPQEIPEDFIKGAFINDNSTVVANFKFLLLRYTFENIKDYIDPAKTLLGTGVNPSVILLDILVTHMEVPIEKIDLQSFSKAEEQLAEEKLGLSLLLTREKTLKEWILEIIKYIDGVLYFDFHSHKYVLKLFRNDYDITTLPVINDSIFSDLKINNPGWGKCVSKFIFKYKRVGDTYIKDTNSGSDEEDTIVVENTYIKEINQVETAKTFDFRFVSSLESMDSLIKRTVKKYSLPLSSAKFKVDYITASLLKPGNVFILESEHLNIPKTVFRVSKVGGDSKDKAYVDIEAIEDIFSSSYGETLNFDRQDSISNLPTDMALHNPPTNTLVYRLPGAFNTSGLSGSRPYYALSCPNPDDYVTLVEMSSPQKSEVAVTKPWYRFKILKTNIPHFVNFGQVGYSRNFKILLENIDNIPIDDIINTEKDFQQGKYIAALSTDYPMTTVKSIKKLSNSTLLLEGVCYLGAIDIEFYSTTFEDPEYEPPFEIYLFLRKFDNGFQIGLDEILFFPTESPYCEDNTKTKFILNIKYKNSLFTSPEQQLERDGCGNQEYRPAPASNIVIQDTGTSKIIKFRPCSILHHEVGALWQNADTFEAGYQEGYVDAYVHYAIERLDGPQGNVTEVYADIVTARAHPDTGYIEIEIPYSDIGTDYYWAITAWNAELGNSISDNNYRELSSTRYITLN